MRDSAGNKTSEVDPTKDPIFNVRVKFYKEKGIITSIFKNIDGIIRDPINQLATSFRGVYYVTLDLSFYQEKYYLNATLDTAVVYKPKMQLGNNYL